jgi:hypothetical protein
MTSSTPASQTAPSPTNFAAAAKSTSSRPPT